MFRNSKGTALMNPLKLSHLSTLSLLNRLRSSQDDEVVVAIILELVIRNDERVIDALIDLTTAESEIVQLTAVWALGEFADSQTIEPLIDIMLREYGDLVPAVMEALRRIGDAAIKPLVAALDTVDEEDFYIVGDAIAHIGTVRSYEEVCGAVDSVNPITRAGAAATLGGFRNPDALPNLTLLALDEHPLVRASAADALQFAVGDAAIRGVLQQLLNDTDVNVVENAIISLGHVGGKAAVEHILPFLSHTDPALVVAAVRALSELEATSAIQPLITLLDNEHDHLRAQVVIALQRLGNTSEIPALIKRLDVEGNADVMRELALAIGKLGDENTLTKIPEKHRYSKLFMIANLHLHDETAFQYFLKLSRSYEVEQRLDAVWAFAAYQHPRSIPPLIAALLDGEWDVRSEAATALGILKAPSAVQPLAQMLNRDEISIVRESVAYALGAIGKPGRSTSALIRALQFDEAEVVRAAAATALGSLQDNKAIKPLIIACLDVSEMVRTAAAQALGRLRNAAALASLRTLLDDDYIAPRIAAREAIRRIEGAH